MKQSLVPKIAISLLFVFSSCVLFAQQPQLPPNYPAALYYESKVPLYSLPDQFVMLNSEKVTDIKTWKEKRRP